MANTLNENIKRVHKDREANGKASRRLAQSRLRAKRLSDGTWKAILLSVRHVFLKHWHNQKKIFADIKEEGLFGFNKEAFIELKASHIYEGVENFYITTKDKSNPTMEIDIPKKYVRGIFNHGGVDYNVDGTNYVVTKKVLQRIKNLRLS